MDLYHNNPKQANKLFQKYAENKEATITNEYLARKILDAAAEEKGYENRLKHGTSSFGFTEFNLNKMDDGSSIFATNSSDITSVYS